jgi:hypothetical protein
MALIGGVAGPAGPVGPQGPAGVGGGAYQFIQEIVATGTGNAVDFTSIPQTYRHLECHIASARNSSGGAQNLYTQVGGSSIDGGGTSYLSSAGSGFTTSYISFVTPGTNMPSTYTMAGRLRIPYYRGRGGDMKSFESGFSARTNNAGAQGDLSAGVHWGIWNGANADIQLLHFWSASGNIYGVFSLYGIT